MSENMNEKKVVIISGASRGLGQAMAQRCMDNGWITAIFSRSESDFIKEARENDPQGNTFFWEALDVNDSKALKTFVFAVYKKFGRVDALINNAGANLDQLLPVTTESDISRILSLNLESAIVLSRLVSRVMLKGNRGVIINISSIIGTRGFKGTSVYSASKAGLLGFTKSLARELGSKGIRVNAVSPGFLATDMTRDMPEGQRNQVIRRTPLGRLGTVGDVTGLVSFLLSDEAGYITGQNIVVDGGLTC